jgi:hypothetical protein
LGDRHRKLKDINEKEQLNIVFVMVFITNAAIREQYVLVTDVNASISPLNGQISLKQAFSCRHEFISQPNFSQ